MVSIFQSSLLVLVVIAFTIYGFGLAALYGALVSFSNTWLFDWYTNKQKAVVDADAQKSFRMAIKSSALRMFSLVALTLIGLGLLELEPKVCKIGNKCLLWNESEGNLGKTIFRAMILIGLLLQPFAVVLRITGSNAD